MNLRLCVVLCVAPVLAACALFDSTDGRAQDAVHSAREGGAQSDPDATDRGEEADPPDDTSSENDLAAERDAGSAPSSAAGRAPASDPGPLAGGSTGSPDAGFGWATDGAVPSTHDASTSVRDGGLIKFDPDASGPVLNPEAQGACIGLLNNICNRSADCQVSLLGLPPEQRARLFESCRNSLWRARNCNRATRTASGFAQCSESTRSLGCIALLATDLSATCADQITLQP